MYIHRHIYIHVYICIIYASLYIHNHICIYVYTERYQYGCMYIHTCPHICTYWWTNGRMESPLLHFYVHPFVNYDMLVSLAVTLLHAHIFMLSISSKLRTSSNDAQCTYNFTLPHRTFIIIFHSVFSLFIIPIISS